MSGSLTTVSATSLPPREAIEYFRGKTNVPTRGWSDVWQEAHARSFMVAGATSQALLADFRQSMTQAIEQGTTLADFRRQFREIVARHGWEHNGTPGWRAQIIYETNLSTAYAAGRWAQLTEPDTLAAFPYWQYVHSGARHPRLQHLAWNGLTLRADDPFWSTHYPPNGWKCGCRVRPLSGRDLARQGKAGPDRAPPITTRPWTRPSDGQVLEVPEGIDPGFGYNVGQAWRQHAPAIPGDARLTPPAGWVPAVPRRHPRPPAEPLVPPGEPIFPDGDYAEWAERLIQNRRPDGSVRILGALSNHAMRWLADREIAPASPALGITSAQLLHLVRDTKASAGRGLPMADVLRLPAIVRQPRAVLRERATGAVLLVFDPSGGIAARAGKLVVQFDMDQRLQRGGERRRVVMNAVKSGGLVDAAQLRARGLYEVIEGSV